MLDEVISCVLFLFDRIAILMYSTIPIAGSAVLDFPNFWFIF